MIWRGVTEEQSLTANDKERQNRSLRGLDRGMDKGEDKGDEEISRFFILRNDRDEFFE